MVFENWENWYAFSPGLESLGKMVLFCPGSWKICGKWYCFAHGLGKFVENGIAHGSGKFVENGIVLPMVLKLVLFCPWSWKFVENGIVLPMVLEICGKWYCFAHGLGKLGSS